MGSISDKLVYLNETKSKIKQAIIDKGQSVADTDTFRSYPEKIKAITSPLTTKDITENGDYSPDTGYDGFSSVNVNVPGADLISKEVTANGNYYASDDDVDGYSQVAVNVIGAETKEKSITANGEYDAKTLDQVAGYSKVTVTVAPKTAAKSVTINGNYNAVDEGLDGYSGVTVNVPTSGGGSGEGGSAKVGTKSISANGTYNASDDKVDGYSTVTVNVSGGTSDPTKGLYQIYIGPLIKVPLGSLLYLDLKIGTWTALSS